MRKALITSNYRPELKEQTNIMHSTKDALQLSLNWERRDTSKQTGRVFWSTFIKHQSTLKVTVNSNIAHHIRKIFETT